MGRKALTYGAALIATYLVVAHGSQAGRLITAGATGGSRVVRTLQGR